MWMKNEKQDEETDRAYTRLSKRIDRYEQTHRTARIIVRFRYLLVAAVIALLVVPAYLFYQLKQQANNGRLVVESVANERKQFTLPDGSTVWLNAGSKIIYPEEFPAGQREVFLSGEAFFDVKKDPQRKFIVKTEKLQIQVLGTQFSLKAYDNEKEISTYLLTGKVQVNFDEGARGDISLSPGEQLIHNKEDHSTTIYKDVKKEQCIAWKEGYLYFDQSTIEEIIYQLERAYGISIEMKSKKLKVRKFTGRLDLHLSPEELLGNIKISVPFNYTKDNTTYTLYD